MPDQPGDNVQRQVLDQACLQTFYGQTPITALSVQRESGAMCNSIPPPQRVASVSRSRRRPLAATPPPTDNRSIPACFHRTDGFAHETIDHGLLKTGGNVRDLLLGQGCKRLRSGVPRPAMV